MIKKLVTLDNDKKFVNQNSTNKIGISSMSFTKLAILCSTKGD